MNSFLQDFYIKMLEDSGKIFTYDFYIKMF